MFKQSPLMLSIVLACIVSATAEPPTSEQIATELGYSAEQIRQLHAGEIVSRGLDEGSDKELAATVAMVVDSSPEATIKAAREGQFYRLNETVQKYHPIDAEKPSIDDFAELVTEDDKTLKELKNLLKAKAGDKFNLSSEEIANLQALRKKLGSADLKKDAAAREEVSVAFRTLLLNRVKAYQAEGLHGIASYDRGGKEATPGNELLLAAGGEKALAKFAQPFYRALTNFPNDLPDGLESHYFWVYQDTQGRPCAVLIHKMILKEEDGSFLGVERQFYVGHTYNSLQIVFGCTASEKGSIIFYTNRTSTDQVAGAGSGLKHNIGRDRMRKTVVKQFEGIRENARTPD